MSGRGPSLASRILTAVRSRFGRDVALLQIASMVNQGSGLFTSVVIFRMFGAVGYGGYAEALNLYGLIFFLGNVGLLHLAVARISEAMGRGDNGGVRHWLGVFTKGYLAFALVLLLVGVSLGPWLGEVIQHDREVGVWAAILCASGPLFAPFSLVVCALQGTRRMKVLAEMENLKEISRTYLVIVGAVAWGSPFGAIAGEVAATLLSIVFAALAYSKARREPGMALPSPKEVIQAAIETSWREVWSCVQTGIAIGLRKNLTVLWSQLLPRLALGYFGSAREVAYLNLAQNLMKIPMQGLAGVPRALMPTLGQLRGAGQIDRLYRVLSRIMILSGGLIGAASAVLVVVLFWFVPAFYGEGARAALELVPWLLIPAILAGFAIGADAFYIVVDKVRAAVVIDVSTALLSLPPGLYLVSEWHALGAVGFVTLAHLGLLAHFVYIAVYFRGVRRARGETARTTDEDARIGGAG